MCLLCIRWLHYPMAVKDAGLRIRVERRLRERFLKICRRQDTPAAHVLRAFMRKYVAVHGPADTKPSPGARQRKDSTGPRRQGTL